MEKPNLPERLLTAGFVMGVILSSACLVLGALYLYTFLNSTNIGINQLLGDSSKQLSDSVIFTAINGRLVMARVALLSCGVFVGMSFGFLGFALFLVGIKGEMQVGAQAESYNVKIARMSPAIFVILCATILIGICVTRQTPYKYSNAQTVNADNTEGLGSTSETLPDPGNDTQP